MGKDGLQIAWPDRLDDDEELALILGHPNFFCARFAAIYRLAGFDIKPKAEAEQAFVIHRMITFWAKYGRTWRQEFGRDVEKHHKQAMNRKKAKPI